MFAKAVVLVLALGACGCTLLSMRQARLQAASQLVQVQLKVRQQDEQLWKLRTRIGAAVTPDHVREMAAGIGPLRPLWPARPGAGSEFRQVVEMQPPPQTRTAPTAAQNKPAARPPAVKPKPAPKETPAQSQRARLATLEPQR